MKNYLLAFLLALLIVLSGASLRKGVAGQGGLGIGSSPIPLPPTAVGIGSSPIPLPPTSQAR